VVGSTPLSRGSPARQREEGDTGRVDKCDPEDYDDDDHYNHYVRGDLNCRVFVDYEVFMKHILHVPDDWETRWRPALDAVKADAKFNKHHNEYCGLCEENSALKKNFYPPLTETANAVLDIVSRSDFNGIPSEKRQHYHINHPNHVKGGAMNRKALPTNPLHVLKVGPYNNALCDGRNMPRLAVNGKCATGSLAYVFGYN
jgi:hypothetical protein